MIQNIKTTIYEHPCMKELCKKTGIKPNTVIGIVVLFFTVILDCTPIGHLLNNSVCLFFPLQDAVCALKSPNPNIKDMKRCLTILVVYAFISMFEPIFKKIIPVFTGFKVVFMAAVTFRPNVLETVQTKLIDAIPITYNNKNTIEQAAKTAEKITAEVTEKFKETVKDK